LFAPAAGQDQSAEAEPAWPTADEPPAEDAPTGRLPIYEAVLSRWFAAEDQAVPETKLEETPDVPPASPPPPAPVIDEAPAGETPTVALPRPEPQPWTSPADTGWELAASLTTNAHVATYTAAGLPKRAPGARLVPGSLAVADPPATPRHRSVGRRDPRRLAEFSQAAGRPPCPPEAAARTRQEPPR
jgi:hypothetical protein